MSGAPVNMPSSASFATARPRRSNSSSKPKSASTRPTPRSARSTLRFETLSKERNKLVDEVGEVQRKVAQARNAKAQKERRQQAMQEASLHRTDNSDQAKKVAVKNKIEAAKQAREDAITVKANEYAKGTFNRANNQLKSAIALYEGDMGSPDSIMESAGQAADLFRQAANEARPKYDAHDDKMKPAARRAALRAEARDTFGGPFTMPETNGVRIVLAMLFEKGSPTVRPSSQALVKSAAELAKKYKEANLTIVGYTRKGNATENLGISNLRAKAVRDYLSPGHQAGPHDHQRDRPGQPSLSR